MCVSFVIKNYRSFLYKNQNIEAPTEKCVLLVYFKFVKVPKVKTNKAFKNEKMLSLLTLNSRLSKPIGRNVDLLSILCRRVITMVEVCFGNRGHDTETYPNVLLLGSNHLRTVRNLRTINFLALRKISVLLFYF